VHLAALQSFKRYEIENSLVLVLVDFAVIHSQYFITLVPNDRLSDAIALRFVPKRLKRCQLVDKQTRKLAHFASFAIRHRQTE